MELAAVLAAVLPENLRGLRLDERVELPIRGAERDSEASGLEDFVWVKGFCCLMEASTDSLWSISEGSAGRRVSRPPLASFWSGEVPLELSSGSMVGVGVAGSGGGGNLSKSDERRRDRVEDRRMALD